MAHVRGRDEDFSSPPAQIPASAANAPGSSLGSNVGGAHGLKPHALRRTAANRIDVAARLSVRTTAACRLVIGSSVLSSVISFHVRFGPMLKPRVATTSITNAT